MHEVLTTVMHLMSASNFPIETKSILLLSNFMLSLSILFLFLLSLTFDVIYTMDFVHHRYLLGAYLAAPAGWELWHFSKALCVCWTAAE